MSVTAAPPAATVVRLIEQVREAAEARRPLNIRAGGTKDFYGHAPRGELLDPRPHSGVVAYEPSELVVTARGGTPLAEIETMLGERGQMLGFEPPHFGEFATLGGCVAAGLAGPRRAAVGVASGAIRDSLLGTKLLDGRGQVLSFGGTVIKNVAGYDVSRLLAGSLGTLGVLLELSLRVAPVPALEVTVRLAMAEVEAAATCAAWVRRGWPVSASAWHDGCLSVRFSGATGAVTASSLAAGGERLDASAAAAFWLEVREQTLPVFGASREWWRLSLPGSAPPLALAGVQFIEWGGALRWLSTTATPAEVRARASALGGHATFFRGARAGVPVFTPRTAAVARIESRIKAEFDPAGIFNPGRMHADEPA